MGLILCEKKDCDKPLYIEDLNINIYSLEELCYLIYDNPILVMEDFIDRDLFAFLSDSLGLENLSAWLMKIYKERKLHDEILYYILEYSGFYTRGELARYKNNVDKMRKLPKSEYFKMQADYMFGIHKYGKAVSIYERIPKLPKDKHLHPKFLGAVYNNLAGAYANMFKFEEAYLHYGLAYECLHDENILMKMYFLEKLGAESREDFSALVSSADIDRWNHAFIAQKDEAERSERIQELREIFRLDSRRRAELMKQRLSALKQEYRTMI